MNYEETILVSLNLSSSWQSIRPSYPKIPIPIISSITSSAILVVPLHLPKSDDPRRSAPPSQPPRHLLHHQQSPTPYHHHILCHNSRWIFLNLMENLILPPSWTNARHTSTESASWRKKRCGWLLVIWRMVPDCGSSKSSRMRAHRRGTTLLSCYTCVLDRSLLRPLSLLIGCAGSKRTWIAPLRWSTAFVLKWRSPGMNALLRCGYRR